MLVKGEIDCCHFSNQTSVTTRCSKDVPISVGRFDEFRMLVRVVSRSTLVMTELERLSHVGIMHYHESNEIFLVNFLSTLFYCAQLEMRTYEKAQAQH